MGRLRVNISKPTKKLDDLMHPLPESKQKKFTLKKKYIRPHGETKASQKEKNKELNPAGVKKPHKISGMCCTMLDFEKQFLQNAILN